MAWRNIWRNPRRTTVLLIAVVIGIWNMIFLSALTRGMEAGMIKNGISTLTGNVQVHHKGYRNDPVIENSITDPDKVEAALHKSLPEGSFWTRRIRVGAVASNARHSAGVTLVGIDPEKEARISFIGKAVTSGRYLLPEDKYKIVVGKALADQFQTRIGHKLILMSPDKNHDVASKAFRIVGIYEAEMKATEKQFVFVSMAGAKKMLKLKKAYSEISIVLNDRLDNEIVAAGLKKILPRDQYEVNTWKELLPILTAYLKLTDGFIYIWYLVVFIAMGFGIVNTILMAVFERIREFGLLKALGMKPAWIIRQVLLESFFILTTGMVIGNLAGFLTVFVVAQNGINLSALAAGAEFAGITRILYPAVYSQDVVMANLVVFILGLIVSLYPAAKAARFTPVEALAHN